MEVEKKREGDSAVKKATYLGFEKKKNEKTQRERDSQ